MQEGENAVGGQAIDRALSMAATGGACSIKRTIACLEEASSRTAPNARGEGIKGRQHSIECDPKGGAIPMEPAIAGSSVQEAIATLDQTRPNMRAVVAGFEGVEQSENSLRGDAKNRTRITISPRLSCAVKIAIAGRQEFASRTIPIACSGE